MTDISPGGEHWENVFLNHLLGRLWDMSGKLLDGSWALLGKFWGECGGDLGEVVDKVFGACLGPQVIDIFDHSKKST